MKHYFLFLLAFAGTQSYAADPAVVNGAGLTSCGQFLEDQKEHGGFYPDFTDTYEKADAAD